LPAPIAPEIIKLLATAAKVKEKWVLASFDGGLWQFVIPTEAGIRQDVVAEPW